MKKVKDAIDTKAIEEKALNHFKSFIEDSKVISQFIADNDKEPDRQTAEESLPYFLTFVFF